MRSDVQTVIAALTTERDALTRAIEALRQISTTTGAANTTIAPHAIAGKRRKERAFIAAGDKAQMVVAMRETARRSHTARLLARQFGVSARTILSGWQQWERRIEANGNRATPTPTEATPDRELVDA